MDPSPFMEYFLLTKISIRVELIFKKYIVFSNYLGRLSRKEYFKKENEELKFNGFESKNINFSQ
jgi:hypothetical protein